MASHKLYGVHAIRNALGQPGRVKTLWLQRGRDDERIQTLIQLAQAQQIPIEFTERSRLTQLANTDKHQGVVAAFSAQPLSSLVELEERLVAQGDKALLLALDGLQDPHNLGACIRSANAFACDAVLIPKKNSVQVTPTVHKVSAGGASLTSVISVSHLGNTLANCKHYHLQCVGLDGEAEESVADVDWNQPSIVVMGAEGTGLRDSIRQQCDRLVQIPMLGEVSSLNVSVATGIVLFEVRRQQHASQR